ncbi:hypothetical protein HPP92_021559 [Vanilla planifolia]|uniref:Uncharacterized protein n=1 Tax=Vanilla planifolia TaxID=51239 RepID=A0A835Q4H7_VANPL|nr:hypothetical protein HPP92_021559 [Vanilla planifolia]
MDIEKADVPADIGEYAFKQSRVCWYVSKMEIEANSPSRKDGIDLKKESYLRNLYCSFIQDLGAKIRVLRTTLCLQYKPHYIAAGSLYLAAKRHGVKLPSANGYVWWHEFEVAPRQLHVDAHNNKKTGSADPQKLVQIHLPADEEDDSSSPESCVLSISGSSQSSVCHVSDLQKVQQDDISENPKSRRQLGKQDLQWGNRDKMIQYLSQDCGTAHIGNDMNYDRYPDQSTNRIRKLEEDRLTTTKKRLIRNESSIRATEQLNTDSFTEKAVESVNDPQKRQRL